MDIAHIDKGLGECVLRASGVLRRGGVIIYPTDTLYGLGADAFSDETVAKIYTIKGRDEGKPMHAVFADMAMVERYAVVNDVTKKLAEKFLPGALTLVLQKRKEYTTGIVRGIETIGIRIPDNEFCLELARSFGSPYIATSANKSGETPQTSIDAIQHQLGKETELVDLAIDASVFPLRPPTTVVNLVSGTPSIIREGAISSDEILSSL